MCFRSSVAKQRRLLFTLWCNIASIIKIVFFSLHTLMRVTSWWSHLRYSELIQRIWDSRNLQTWQPISRITALTWGIFFSTFQRTEQPNAKPAILTELSHYAVLSYSAQPSWESNLKSLLDSLANALRLSDKINSLWRSTEKGWSKNDGEVTSGHLVVTWMLGNSAISQVHRSHVAAAATQISRPDLYFKQRTLYRSLSSL